MTMDYLSPEIYGIWLTVSSVIVWLNFFDVGFTLGLKNKLAEALADGDYVRGKKAGFNHLWHDVCNICASHNYFGIVGSGG